MLYGKASKDVIWKGVKRRYMERPQAIYGKASKMLHGKALKEVIWKGA